MAAPIITPGTALTIDGGWVTAFTADQPVTWSKSGGALSLVTSTSVTWTAPNQTGNFTLTATNPSLQTDIVAATVRAVVPGHWAWMIPRHAKKPVLIFTPIYGQTQTRGFGNNAAIHEWELGSDNTTFEGLVDMKAFWDYHHPGKQFDLVDPTLTERRRYETDSDFDFHPSANHINRWQWSFRIKEAYPFALIT